MGGAASSDEQLPTSPSSAEPAGLRSPSSAEHVVGSPGRSLGHHSSFAREGRRSMNARRVSFQGEGPDRADEVFPHKVAPKDCAMRKIVVSMYNKVIADPALAPFLARVDLQQLYQQQEKLMMLVFGGDDLLQEEDVADGLRRAYAQLNAGGGLSMQHWERFVQHLDETLAETPELPEASKQQAAQRVRSSRDYFESNLLAQPVEVMAIG